MSSVHAVDPNKAFESYFGKLVGSSVNADNFNTSIKESAEIFRNALGLSAVPAVPAQPPAAVAPLNDHEFSHDNCCCHHRRLNNRVFWIWVGTHPHTPYYSYQRRTIWPSFIGGYARGVGFETAGRRRDSEAEAKRMIALITVGVVLSDVAAVVGAVYVTSKAIQQANDAAEQEAKIKGIAHTLKSVVPATTSCSENPAVEGKLDPREHLEGIADHLKSIGRREAACSKVRAISTGLLATAAVGAFHALISGIACAIIAGTASISSTAAGLSAYAFFSVGFCPPVLLAIAAIGAVGLLFLTVLRKYNKEEKDKLNADEGLRHLNALINPVVKEGDVKESGEGHPSAVVRPGPTNPDAHDHEDDPGAASAPALVLPATNPNSTHI